MYAWVETNLRTLLRRHRAGERGQAELVLVVLIAFLLMLIVTGHRIIVQ
jgi:hypothetical protein